MNRCLIGHAYKATGVKKWEVASKGQDKYNRPYVIKREVEIYVCMRCGKTKKHSTGQRRSNKTPRMSLAEKKYWGRR